MIAPKQLEKMRYFTYVSSIRNYARYTRETESSIQQQEDLHQHAVLKFKAGTSEVLYLEHTLNGAETWKSRSEMSGKV
jgi:hypothetical protein